jgi:hypothetical protein
MTLFLQICDGRPQPVDPLDNEIDRLRHDGDPVVFNEGGRGVSVGLDL